MNMDRQSHREPPETCPSCGADVPRGSEACPECGSDYNTGWNEEATRYDGLDLPDPEFDHDEFLRKELPESAKPGRGGSWLLAVVLLIIFILFAIFMTV